jgi:hypothetical protein
MHYKDISERLKNVENEFPQQCGDSMSDNEWIKTAAKHK